MLTKFQKNKLKEMIAVLLPVYKYVRITSGGTVVLKQNWYSFRKESYSFTDFCLGILAPLISEYKYACKDMTLAYYLGFFGLVQRKKNAEILDYLYSEFSRFKAFPEYVEVEAHFERIVKEHNWLLKQAEEAPKLTIIVRQALNTKTLKLIIALLFAGSLAYAM